jgi:wobble nucleotide-excising tRNase
MKGGHEPADILSEGEQKAVALADFLTEVGLNPVNAGIVLDDPVTSQDHERKTAIASRLVNESAYRQVVVFTHDLVFLNQLLKYADDHDIVYEAHWIDRDDDGRPGYITLGDVPATSKAYDTPERARQFFAEAQTFSGKPRHAAITAGMGALRRTIEETIAKKLFKDVVPRWSDRVIVTGLRKIAWDDGLADELVTVYEELSN